jgi:hypothetical protein
MPARDGFRAHQATIDQVQELHREGRCELRTFWEVKPLHGNGKVEAVTIRNNKTKEEETFDVDAVIPLLGFHSDLGAIEEWGLDAEKADIKGNPRMETNVRASTRRATSPATPASSSSNHLRPHEEPQFAGLRLQPVQLDSYHAALRKVHAHARRRAAEEDRGELLNPGGMPHHGDDGVAGLLVDVALEPDQVGIVGQRLTGDRRLSHPRDLRQDRGSLGSAGPGTGEHERRREIPLAEPAAHLALHLAASVGQRTVAIVGPLGGVALPGVGVAIQEVEHGELPRGGEE